MKKRLSLKDLLHAAWNQFASNFTHWLFLYFAQIVAFVSFLLCCVILLALVHYFFVDLCMFQCALSDYSKIFTVSMISVISIFSTCFFIAFPIMYRQNALDSVFGRELSGFDVNNRFFSYALAMFFYWIIVAGASCLFLLPGLFLAQRWRFVGLYLLDHGGNLRKAFYSSWVMTRGYMWFLAGISMLQWLIFLFCGVTVFCVFFALTINRLIDAIIYKQLHMEFDKNLAVCSCEF